MKVLVITYYWPPAGGPGVQRWLKFVKYFKEYGIEPVVYVPENPTYAIEDHSLASDIPGEITIVKRPVFEPYRFAEMLSKKNSKTISKGIIPKKDRQSFFQKVLLFIRGNFFIPDARKFWVRPSIRFLETYITENEINTVITTGPPHSVHLIGLGLKNRLGVKWLADFRDPWTTIGYHKELKLTAFAARKHKRLEKEVLQTADHLVVTSFTTQKEFSAITPKPITVITNGYDVEEIEEITPDTTFTISHIGSLLSGRDPKQLWKALSELTLEQEDFGRDFRLRLVGAVSEEVLASIKDAGLKPFLTQQGYVSHKKAVEIQRCSQVLLLIEINSEATRSIIPGKLFEYMVSKRPIFAVGPSQADISKIITETQSGVFFEYHEHQQMKAQLLAYYELYRNGNLKAETKDIEKYSRRELTRDMAKVLKEL